MTDLEMKNYHLHQCWKRIEDLKDEVARRHNRERKAMRSLRWFDKGAEQVQKEIAESKAFLEALDSHIPNTTDDLSFDMGERRKWLEVRMTTLNHRADLYSDKKRKEKTEDLITCSMNVECFEKILADNEARKAKD